MTIPSPKNGGTVVTHSQDTSQDEMKLKQFFVNKNNLKNASSANTSSHNLMIKDKAAPVLTSVMNTAK